MTTSLSSPLRLDYAAYCVLMNLCVLMRLPGCTTGPLGSTLNRIPTRSTIPAAPEFSQRTCPPESNVTRSTKRRIRPSKSPNQTSQGRTGSRRRVEANSEQKFFLQLHGTYPGINQSNLRRGRTSENNRPMHHVDVVPKWSREGARVSLSGVANQVHDSCFTVITKVKSSASIHCAMKAVLS